jgi:nucleotide-binding universal stress UspA family protein
VVVVHAMEVPLSLPLDARLDMEEDAAEALLDDAQALVESYGVRAVTRLLRARKAGPAIVEEARRRDAELVLLGAPRQTVAGRRALFGGTVDYVLRESPCRVLVAAGKRAA